ncbi:MAG: YfhO family protein [Bacteroidota bacterium]
MKAFFQKNWIHFAIVALFFILTLSYFNLQFDGYGLKQHDIEQFKGMSHEIVDYRERTGEETMWTNSMFGGMPTMQISLIYEGNLISKVMQEFVKSFPPPAGVVFLYMLGFYIFALCLRLNPWVGLLGAIAFGFSTYDVIIIQAGHNSKALAAAFMAPVIGAFIMAFQRNMKWGILLSALFMTIEISMNHLQVTYYLGFLILALGIVMFVEALRKKEFKKFFMTTGGIVIAYFIALMINYGNISLTNDYAKHTIRGANDITTNPDGSSNMVNSTEGLDRDYVTQWSYGIGESFTIISPYVKGGGTVVLGDSPFAEDVQNLDMKPSSLNAVMQYPVYWGDQPITSGPVYVGVIVAFLAFLGLIFLKGPIKWALLAVTILTLALSWGKNYMGLTNFFLDNIPGYNKFRAVTIILMIVELTIPVLGVLFLNQLLKERETLALQKKKFLIVSGVFVAFLLIVKVVGLGDNYMSTNDAKQFEQIEAGKLNVKEGIKNQILQMAPAEQQKYGVNVSDPAQLNQFIEAQYEQYVSQNPQLSISEADVKTVRESIFSSSMNRSILFSVLAFGVLALFFYTQISSLFIVLGLTVLVAIDLIPVSRNYLGNQEQGAGYKYWDIAANTMFPISTNSADVQILEMETSLSPNLTMKVAEGEKQGKSKALELNLSGNEKNRVVDAYKFAALNRNSNYRVFDFTGGFSSANASYFHKSLGGYHGAKLRNIQNLYEFHLSQSNNKVYDMMNVKYFIQETEQGKMANPNMTALGNAWFVKKINAFETPDDEIRALGNQFEVKNIGQGSLVVNGQVKTSAKVYGSEKLKYVLKGDSLDVRLTNGMQEGMEALFVMDINGKTNLIPKMTMQMDTANSFLRLVELKVTDEFKHDEEAIMLKSEAQKVKSRTFTGNGKINMTAYEPNKITYSVEANGNQFAVFSEVYYPEGWIATIDGKEVEIRKTNYLLRGLEIPRGKHKVEFTFMLPKYEKAGMWSMLGSLIIILSFVVALFFEFKRKKVVE